MSLFRLGTKALHVFDPETAHGHTIRLLKTGLGPSVRADQWPALRTRVAGIDFANPLGLAAGFDKHAEVPDACLGMGFGFVEVGAVTPLPQPGNPKPRVFRLSQERAVINRYGFNSEGMDAAAARLATRAGRVGIVGVNLGANKESQDRLGDFAKVAEAVSPHVRFVTVNVSSPNTPGLRALQNKDDLAQLLNSVRSVLAPETALLLKIAPDLGDEDKADIAALAVECHLDALVVSNTTLRRDLLRDDPEEAGGLSGRPLYQFSTEVLAEFARSLSGRVPLVGVGGVGSGADAYGKITHGASLVQLYSALVYSGPDLVAEILGDLAERLAMDGYKSVDEAVGAAL